MSLFQEQTITCKDCSTSFVFTAEQAKTFEAKGYKNLPLRCEECRKKKSAAVRRARRFPRRRPYTEPLPVPTGLDANGTTKYNAGKVAFVGRGFGFIDYNGGQLFFVRSAFDGDQTKLRQSLYVDFTVTKDEKDRLCAKTVSPATSVPPEVLAAEKAKDEAKAAEGGNDRPRRTNNRRPAAGGDRRRRPGAAAAGRGGERKRRVGGRGEGSAAAKKENGAERAERPERTMINVVVERPSKGDNVTVQKPDTGATFGVFRRILYHAFKKDLPRGFKLYHGEDLLNYDSFNQLKEGDKLSIREEAEAEQH